METVIFIHFRCLIASPMITKRHICVCVSWGHFKTGLKGKGNSWMKMVRSHRLRAWTEQKRKKRKLPSLSISFSLIPDNADVHFFPLPDVLHVEFFFSFLRCCDHVFIYDDGKTNQCSLTVMSQHPDLSSLYHVVSEPLKVPAWECLLFKCLPVSLHISCRHESVFPLWKTLTQTASSAPWPSDSHLATIIPI